MDFPSAKTSLQHPMKYALVLVTALFLTRASQAVEGVFPLLMFAVQKLSWCTPNMEPSPFLTRLTSDPVAVTH